jgi:hypothetical protein
MYVLVNDKLIKGFKVIEKIIWLELKCYSEDVFGDGRVKGFRE